MQRHGKKTTTIARSLLAATVMVLAGASLPAKAAETLVRVGKAVPEAFSFVPVDVGVRTGIFKKHGLDVQITAFAGSAKQQQAMTANSIDVGLGAGTDFIFMIKGAPLKAVAAMAGRPLLLTVIVRNDGSIKSVDDLKGKRVSVSTAGALTYWLVLELSRQKGWGPNGIIPTPMGATPPQIAALKRKDIDGVVTDIATALELERKGEAKVIVRFGDLIKDFHIHTIMATDQFIKEKPDALRAFLAGWFETIAFMNANKAETVKISADVMKKDKDITEKTYDALMPMFSTDGKFDQKALATISRSYVELKQLPKEPDLKNYYTEAYLPKK